MKAVKVVKMYATNAQKETEKCPMAISVQSTLNVKVDIVKVESLLSVVENAEQREREEKVLGVIGCVARVLAVNMGKKSVGNVLIVTNGLRKVHALKIVIVRITLASQKRPSGEWELL